jgi:cobyrinic acid a,c-diamide synthase
LPIYAECGGFIYLGRSLAIGKELHAMTGVLPVDFILERKPQAHGYTVMETSGSSLFIDKGVSIRGHEFHYSRVAHVDGQFPMAYYVTRGNGINGKEDGLVYKNVVAAYTHVHALATPEWAPAMIRKAREYRFLRQRA